MGGEVAAISGGRRGPLGQSTSCPQSRAEFGLPGSGNKGWGLGSLGLGRMVGCQPLRCVGTRGPGHCPAQGASGGASSRGDCTWRSVCECVLACGGGARPELPGAVVRCVAEAGRASRGRARCLSRTRALAPGGWAVAGSGRILIFVLPGLAPFPGLFSC